MNTRNAKHKIVGVEPVKWFQSYTFSFRIVTERSLSEGLKFKATVSNQRLLSLSCLQSVRWVPLNSEAGSLYIINGPMGSPGPTDRPTDRPHLSLCLPYSLKCNLKPCHVILMLCVPIVLVYSRARCCGWRFGQSTRWYTHMIWIYCTAYVYICVCQCVCVCLCACMLVYTLLRCMHCTVLSVSVVHWTPLHKWELVSVLTRHIIILVYESIPKTAVHSNVGRLQHHWYLRRGVCLPQLLYVDCWLVCINPLMNNVW